MNPPDEADELMIDLTVNGRTRQQRAFSTLADLVASLGLAPASIATAVNGEHVAREQRAATVLCDGDQVSCFQAIVGG